MNNIEKLVEPTEAEYLAHAEQEELLLFASKDDYLAIANGVWELFVKRAKALQSFEPVGEIKIHMIGANDVCAIQWIGNYQPKVGDKLFTLPPAFVPKSEYNKLLDALRIIASANLSYRQDNHMVDIALEAIAEAEGKEG